MLAVTVRFTIRPGYEKDFLDRVMMQARDSLDREPDCTQFDVCRHPADPRTVFLYEIYRDAAAFAAHLQMPHFVAFDTDTRPWIEDKIVERWERV